MNGGDTHAWEARGLDTLATDELVIVRECVWCRLEQVKPYGKQRSSWRPRVAKRSTA